MHRQVDRSEPHLLPNGADGGRVYDFIRVRDRVRDRARYRVWPICCDPELGTVDPISSVVRTRSRSRTRSRM